MVRRFPPELMLKLPSGSSVHPCRLIVRDGSLMWKQAFTSRVLPGTTEQEEQIIKCAIRLEELLRWLPESDAEEHVQILQWLDPTQAEYEGGSRCRFVHKSIASEQLYGCFVSHLAGNEELMIENNSVIFDLKSHTD